MAGGRQQDNTIPPSPGHPRLCQQHDYRARKAQYLADLEQWVKKAEDENHNLHREVNSLQARLSSTVLPEVTAASLDLMHHLAVVSTSIIRFHQLAYYTGQAGNMPGHYVNCTPITPITLSTPTDKPSPGATPHAHKLSVSPHIEVPPLAIPNQLPSERE